VRAALETETLDAARWKNFKKLQRELAREARKDDKLALAAVHRQRVTMARAQRARLKASK
jgi:hypothetical protein